ncbi:MAG: hypothetical protein WCG45_05965 [bacterium]
MNNDTPLDMLQIKIDRAREDLPLATRKAIETVDWRAIILSFREKKGYSFEQLEDLELETELLLCGLLNPVEYPKKLEETLKLPKSQIDLLVNEMNELVFRKIKDELIKNSQKEDMFVKKESPDNIGRVVATDEHTISPNIIKAEPIKPIQTSMPTIEGIIKTENTTTNIPKKPEIEKIINTNSVPIVTPIPKPTMSPVEIITGKPAESILSQKLSGSFQIPATTTEYTLPSLGKDKTVPIAPSTSVKTSKVDPYRIDPNE